MRVAFFLWIACLWSAHAASASTIELSPERQAWLEGVWSGLPTDVSANKLCSRLSPPPGAITLAIEFQKTGGVIFYSDGSQTALRGMISSASEKNGVYNLTMNDEVFRFRPDGERIMFRVRSSASIGGYVDVMVFRRCEQPADRSAIDIDADAMKFLASDLPGDEAFFIDERIAPKSGDRCAVQETQYLFFALVGPSQFRLSRWNSFAVADKLASKKPVKTPLDPIADWLIESIHVEGGKYVVRLKDFENGKALPETIHVEPRPGGITIPQWKRSYVRCTGFQSRS
ncbi:MAG: hypothetical protein ACK59B_12720 [Alphaproteobacteria bacterium]